MQPRGLFQRAPLPPAAVLGGAIASKAAEIQCERFAADRSNCLNPADAPGGERGERRGRMVGTARKDGDAGRRSEEHTSELQSLMRISYAVFCLKNKTQN